MDRLDWTALEHAGMGYWMLRSVVQAELLAFVVVMMLFIPAWDLYLCIRRERGSGGESALGTTTCGPICEVRVRGLYVMRERLPGCGIYEGFYDFKSRRFFRSRVFFFVYSLYILPRTCKWEIRTLLPYISHFEQSK